MINLFIASGNLGKDIAVQFTPNGKCIGTFSLPVKSGWGEHEKVSWVRCKLLGDRAEKLSPYLKKGLKVTVHGKFELEQWEKDGVKHSMPCIIIDNVDLPAKGDSQAPQQTQAPVNRTAPQAAPESFDDLIPF